MRDKATLLLACELHPRLDPTYAAARIERALHATFHVRGAGAAGVARSGDPDARSPAYLHHLQDRFKRLQGVVGTLIRSQLLSGALLHAANVHRLIQLTKTAWRQAYRRAAGNFPVSVHRRCDVDLQRVLEMHTRNFDRELIYISRCDGAVSMGRQQSCIWQPG